MLPLVVFIVVAIVFALFLSRPKNRKNVALKSPPSPPSLPLVEHTHLVLLEDIDKVAHKLNTTYGDVVEVFLAGERMVMVSGEHVKSVLNSSNYYTRWLREEGLREIGMYEQAIAFNHIIPHWKSQRSFFKNNIGGNFLSCVPPTAAKNARKLVNILKQMEGKPVNIANYMNRLALDNVGELAFGRTFDTLTEDASETAEKINAFMQAWIYFVITPPTVFKYLRPFTTQTHRESVRQLSEQVQDIIRQRRQEIEKNPSLANNATDFLGALLVARDEDDADKMLTDTEVQMLVREMLLAGADTSANSLTFLFYWLAKNPHIQDKMVEEFRSVVGSADPTYETQSKLIYTEQVLFEGQRLSPGSPVIPRRAIDDDTIGEYDIPAGTNILVNLWSNNVNEKYWEDPFSFKPERFASENLKTVPEYKNIYFPFGYGGRSCPGQMFARVLMKTVLCILLQNFKFSLVHPEKNLETMYCIVSQPKGNELLVYVTPRN